MGGRLAESVAILLFTPLLAAAYYFGIRVWLTRSPSVRQWSQRPLGASLLLLITGLVLFDIYEIRKPEGTSLRQWITSNPHLLGMTFLWLLPLALLLLSLVALAMLAIVIVTRAGLRLLGGPVRPLRREPPPLPAFRNEQELIEQMHRDLELGRKARTRGED